MFVQSWWHKWFISQIGSLCSHVYMSISWWKEYRKTSAEKEKISTLNSSSSVSPLSYDVKVSQERSLLSLFCLHDRCDSSNIKSASASFELYTAWNIFSWKRSLASWWHIFLSWPLFGNTLVMKNTDNDGGFLCLELELCLKLPSKQRFAMSQPTGCKTISFNRIFAITICVVWIGVERKSLPTIRS